MLNHFLKVISGIEKIIITGSNGFLGRNLVLKLANEGNFIYAFSRSKSHPFNHKNVQLIVTDYNDSFEIEKYILESDIFIHTAENPVFGNDKSVYLNNYEFSKRLIDACYKKNSNIQFIYISSIAAIDRKFGDHCNHPIDENSKSFPKSDYGLFKKKVEDYLIVSKLNHLIIRPALVVGEQMRPNSHFSFFIKNILKKKFMFRILWTGSFSIIHIDDLCSAINLLIVKNINNEIFLCGGYQIKYSDFLEKNFEELKFYKFSLLLYFLNLFSPYLPFKLKSMIVGTLTANDQKLQKLTGWKPITNIHESFKSIIIREKSRMDPLFKSNYSTIVTGASSGLGKELSLKLSGLRKKIYLIDKDEKAFRNIKNSFRLCSHTPGSK